MQKSSAANCAQNFAISSRMLKKNEKTILKLRRAFSEAKLKKFKFQTDSQVRRLTEGGRFQKFEMEI